MPSPEEIALLAHEDQQRAALQQQLLTAPLPPPVPPPAAAGGGIAAIPPVGVPVPVAPAASAAPVGLAAPAAPIEVPPVDPIAPPQPRTVTDTQTTVSRTVLSPQQRANLAAQTKNVDDQAALLKQKGEVDKRLAGVNAEQAAAQAAQAEARAAELKRINDEAQAQRQEARVRLDAAIKEREGLKPADYMSGKTQGQKLMAALALAIGARASAYLGGSNKAADILNSAIEQDWKAQRAKIEAANDKVLMARTGLRDADEARDAALRAVDVNYAAATESIKVRFAQRFAQEGVPAAEINSQQEILKLQQLKTQIESKALEGTEKRISSTTQKRIIEGASGGPGTGRVTESQGKAQDYLTGMIAEHQRMERMPPMSQKASAALRQQIYMESLYEKSPTAALAADLVKLNKDISERLDPSDRQAVAAARRWLDPIMRERSGAVIRPDEAKAYVDNFFRQKGDTDQDVSIKRQARIDAMNGMTERTSNPQEWRGRISGASGAAPQRISGPDAAQLLSFVRDNPNDPRSDQARAILRANGLLR